MDMDKAKELMAGAGDSSVSASWSEIRAELAGKHSDHPQRAQMADMALRTIETGIAELEKLGHQFHLVPGPAAVGGRFPLMLYRNGPQGLENKVVDSESALEEARPDGWLEQQGEAMKAPARAPEQLAGEDPKPEMVGETKKDLIARPEPQPASPAPSALASTKPPALSGDTDAKLPETVEEDKTKLGEDNDNPGWSKKSS